jgi:hypothetical protein
MEVAIQAAVCSDDPSGEGVVVTGYVVIAEVMDISGERWLLRHTNEDLTTWARNGMLQEGLEDWDEGE